MDAVYIIGGIYTQDIVAEFKNDQWHRLANLNQGRNVHGSMTIGGQTMIIGGRSDNQTLVYSHNFSANVWKHFLSKSLFSPLVTEIWQLENGNNKIIDPALPDNDYVGGIALYVVEKDFCQKWYRLYDIAFQKNLCWEKI